ncbi:MAG: hypothetical protein VKJ46_11395 [Leptolyngbyaceae bacterium]|nr:hypothetical protein [Leptolyngbyaceae bacterium]
MTFHNPSNMLDTGFQPETWLAILALTLGTLIVVISIASQNIPKLIDLYMQDWISLFYIWFLVISSAHNVFIQIHGEPETIRISSVILNLYVLLPVSLFLSFPYTFYILRCTQPSVVINKIFNNHLDQLNSLAHKRTYDFFKVNGFVEEKQAELFKSLNQLDNLLESISLKEAEARIIQSMGILVQEYVIIKPLINPQFFKVSTSVRSDISFKTMISQFDVMEETSTFYEQKCFRLLGNTYVKLLERQEFDLASLCGSEMNRIAFTALRLRDDQLLDIIIIRFNTMLRFALKHGVKNNEARHLYNLAFHYRNFIENLVKYGKIQHSKRSFRYLRLYGTEIFKYGRTSPSMYFIVDVFAAEMKRILILAYQQNWTLEIQGEFLNEMLQIDSPPDIEGDLDRAQVVNNGVRVLQIGLGLFYLRSGLISFVERIIADLLDDLEFLGEKTFRRGIELTCDRLKNSSPTFWEDTDRGNLNLYYTPDYDQIDAFQELIYKQMQTHRAFRTH